MHTPSPPPPHFPSLRRRHAQISPSVGALAQDHRNDVLTNIATIVAIALARQFPVVWWLDPGMAIALALLIVTTWSITGKGEAACGTGPAMAGNGRTIAPPPHHRFSHRDLLPAIEVLHHARENGLRRAWSAWLLQRPHADGGAVQGARRCLAPSIGHPPPPTARAPSGYIKQLTGKVAERELVSQLTYLAMNHDERIVKVRPPPPTPPPTPSSGSTRGWEGATAGPTHLPPRACAAQMPRAQVDTVRAYYVGTKLLVEVDIVLPPEMELRTAHDIGEGLQHELEVRRLQLEECVCGGGGEGAAHDRPVPPRPCGRRRSTWSARSCTWTPSSTTRPATSTRCCDTDGPATGRTVAVAVEVALCGLMPVGGMGAGGGGGKGGGGVLD
jgi:hypothetical protein